MTKESLAARVVDRQQVGRTISKEEMLHLFEFGDDENLDTLADLGLENGHTSNNNMTGQVGNSQTMPPQGSCSSDKIMESLLGKHYPRYISFIFLASTYISLLRDLSLLSTFNFSSF